MSIFFYKLFDTFNTFSIIFFLYIFSSSRFTWIYIVLLRFTGESKSSSMCICLFASSIVHKFCFIHILFKSSILSVGFLCFFIMSLKAVLNIYVLTLTNIYHCAQRWIYFLRFVLDLKGDIVTMLKSSVKNIRKNSELPSCGPRVFVEGTGIFSGGTWKVFPLQNFCCGCPYEKNHSFCFTPSQSTLKYGSENHP